MTKNNSKDSAPENLELSALETIIKDSPAPIARKPKRESCTLLMTVPKTIKTCLDNAVNENLAITRNSYIFEALIKKLKEDHLL